VFNSKLIGQTTERRSTLLVEDDVHDAAGNVHNRVGRTTSGLITSRPSRQIAACCGAGSWHLPTFGRPLPVIPAMLFELWYLQDIPAVLRALTGGPHRDDRQLVMHCRTIDSVTMRNNVLHP
jgi:hypothetical protein